ncbi:PrpR N-terminal domain-containing protein [Enterocloster lavalensis]|uniref:PrpR N-terminal domain-containing protein n=1 Tax=Enterocloster lavalensis TaxID=460384 RepID=UPI001D05F8C8|nr:PrpR N-terminal domain-containing protein [Enterocloster lavalensis]MCB6346112.1 PrpR N-terminal domain-containing protein [Enterocloster lavalensis]
MIASIQILAIVPYEELSPIFRQAAAKFPELSVSVLVYNAETILLDIRKAVAEKAVDVIIAHREGISFLTPYIDVPAVPLEFSPYDILRAIRAGQCCNEPFAVVGSPDVISSARLLSEINNEKLHLHEYLDDRQARSCFSAVLEEKINLVITDMCCAGIADSFGLCTIPLNYGREAVNHALSEAGNIVSQIYKMASEDLPLRETLSSTGTCIAIYTSARECCYKNAAMEAILTDKLENSLLNRSKELTDKKEIYFTIRNKTQIYSVKAVRFTGRKLFFAFYIETGIAWTSPSPCVQIEYDRHAKIDMGIQFIADEKTKSVIQQIRESSTSVFPIFIYGETGTGTVQCVRFIHSISIYKNNPFIRVNCELLTEKYWQSLVNNVNSPLNSNNCTVYFKKLQCLSDPMQQILDSYIEDTLLTRRNQVICSAYGNIHELVKNGGFRHSLYNKLFGLPIRLPSLNECPEQIPTIASIFLSRYNEIFSKQVIGFEPAAITLLQHFHWSVNLDQLERTVRMLVSSAKGSYITAEEVKSALNYPDIRNTDTSWLSLDSTLDVIEGNIIEKILLEENMNFTKAAKRLGINRSTLWRKRRDLNIDL